jgi:hypothetical protein
MRLIASSLLSAPADRHIRGIPATAMVKISLFISIPEVIFALPIIWPKAPEKLRLLASRPTYRESNQIYSNAASMQ